MKVQNSQRLSYRFLTANDAQLLFELDQDPAVMQYINGGKMSTMNEIHSIILPRMASYSDLKKGWGLWGVFTLDTDQFIGWILVRPMAFFSESPVWHDLELGWRFKQASWGKGYATEAATQIKDELASQGQATHYSAVALPGNEGSINIMKKLGMKYIKTELHKDPLGNQELVFYQAKF